MRVLPANAPPRMQLSFSKSTLFVRLQSCSLPRAERHLAFAAQDRPLLRASRYVSSTLFAGGRLRKLEASG